MAANHRANGITQNNEGESSKQDTDKNYKGDSQGEICTHFTFRNLALTANLQISRFQSHFWNFIAGFGISCIEKYMVKLINFWKY